MSFWVYENWVVERAVLHLGECRHCNEGQGKRGRADAIGVRDQWHGPFVDIAAAQGVQIATGRRHRVECQICRP